MIRSLGSSRGSIGFCPLECILGGYVGIILSAVWSGVGGVCAPMFLAERTVLLGAPFLWDPVTNGVHLPHGQVARLGGILGSVANLLGWVGLSNAFKDFKKFPDTLWSQSSTELILVLSV